MFESLNCPAGNFVGKEKPFLSAHINGLRTVLTGKMPARIEFTDDQVNEMVTMYQYGFSSHEIGDWFNISVPTVLDRLRTEGIEIGPPIYEREKPWNYVERDIPDPWANTDAAYVFGVLIGDASIQYNYNNSEKGGVPDHIALNTPDDEFGAIFSDAVKLAFGIQVKKKCRFRAHSVDLGRSYDRFKWRTEAWRVPKSFLDAPSEIKVALCQGKTDSDGTVDKGAVEITSIYKRGLEDMQKIMENLSYKTTLNGPYRKKEKNRQEQYVLRILNALPELFRLPRKKQALQKAID